MLAIPPEKLVSMRFVVVMFTVVMVPATNKSEDKYILAPVMVEADNQDVPKVENDPKVEWTLPTVIAVALIFSIVPLGAYKLPALIELVAKMVPTVIPVASIDPELIAVETTLLIVAKGAYTLALLTCVVAKTLAAVTLVTLRDPVLVAVPTMLLHKMSLPPAASPKLVPK